VHIKNGFRGYAFPTPLIDSPDGIPILANDTLAGIHDGLRRVCAPDAPEGRIAAGARLTLTPVKSRSSGMFTFLS
jgi:hypothetical protein